MLAASCVRLGVLGARLTDAVARQLAPLGLVPKHVGLLAAVETGAATTQREIATVLRVAPSLVVTLVDQLEACGAVVRERREGDRRVQEVKLTAQGTELLAHALVVVEAADDELRQRLGESDYQTLQRLLEAALEMPSSGKASTGVMGS